MTALAILVVVLAVWIGVSIVLALAVGRSFAAGQARGDLTPAGRLGGGRPAASPALPR